jgi:type I restriction enzyme M protein
MPGLSAATKRQVLEALDASRLRQLLDELGLETDRRSAAGMRSTLADGRKADFAAILSRLTRDELKAVAAELGLTAPAGAKAALVDAILRLGDSSAAPANDDRSRKGKVDAPGEGEESERRSSTNLPAPAERPPSSRPRVIQTSTELTNFIVGVTELLQGDYKQSDYGKVVLPFTVLRRIDCVLADTKAQVLAEYEKRKHGPVDPGHFLKKKTGVHFFNTSPLDFDKLRGDPSHIAQNLTSYIQGLNPEAREIIERFKLADEINKLDEADLLFQLVGRFADVDLHPKRVPNEMMGNVFEELIRRFAELSNETAGEHFTPREVIRLMVNLVFTEDSDVLSTQGAIRTLYDPAAGTGGMLSVAQDYLREMHRDAHLEVFGQELNDASFAVCKADLMLKGQNPENIQAGNSFSRDGHADRKFDYQLSNPPFGVEWKKVEKEVRDEHEKLGFAGRFGPGLPRINDGSMLFLLHMIHKMAPPKEDIHGTVRGARLCIVLNGSPLFTGDAGSGESEIRRWILENDMLEAIVALPNQLFYNTGINTYVWVVTNHKPEPRRGKVQLINATKLYQKMRKSLGDKRHEMTAEHIRQVSQIFGEFAEGSLSKIFDNEEFGYRRITVERPLRVAFQALPERLDRLKEEAAFRALAVSRKKGPAGEEECLRGRSEQQSILKALAQLDSGRTYRNRSEFERDLERRMTVAGITLTGGLRKAVLDALSEPDQEADICTNRQGSPEPDVELRDVENVPLKEDIHAYFECEVRPHVPDAWIDESKTKLGYEIPFTRYFYEYTPSRTPSDIASEILAAERDVQQLLAKAFR